MGERQKQRQRKLAHKQRKAKARARVAKELAVYRASVEALRKPSIGRDPGAALIEGHMLAGAAAALLTSEYLRRRR